MSISDRAFTDQRNCSVHFQLAEAVSVLGLLMRGHSLAAPVAPSHFLSSSHPSGPDAHEGG